MTSQPRIAQPRVKENDYGSLRPAELGCWEPALTVSVVIPAYGSQDKLDLTLAALAAPHLGRRWGSAARQMPCRATCAAQEARGMPGSSTSSPTSAGSVPSVPAAPTPPTAPAATTVRPRRGHR